MDLHGRDSNSREARGNKRMVDLLYKINILLSRAVVGSMDNKAKVIVEDSIEVYYGGQGGGYNGGEGQGGSGGFR